MRTQTAGDLELLRVMNRIKMFRLTGWGIGRGSSMPACIVTNNLAGMIKDKSPMMLNQIAMLCNWVQSYMPDHTSTIVGCINYKGMYGKNHLYKDRNGVERLT